MPPKKKSKSSAQPTLVQFIENEKIENDPAVIETKLEKEIQKLIKIRKQKEQKNREEAKVIKNILKLQINDDNLKSQTMEQQQMVEQEYWIRTDEKIMSLGTLSILKFILQDYGQVIQNGKDKQNSKEQQQEQELISEVSQWKKRGSLNSTYLQQYTPNFINSLQQYQYLANQMNK